ncbi:hypothetical protein C4A30_03720 [Escherichia coli]|nr:hypothetical protein C4A30_03720 [Escherichia coli]
MQVIALNTVNLPVYGHAFVHNNTGTGPGTSVRGCYCVIITERQGTRPLRNRILQINLSILSQKFQILTGIQVISLLPVHGICGASLCQRTSSGAAVKAPLQCTTFRCSERDRGIIVFIKFLPDKIQWNNSPPVVYTMLSGPG